MGLLDMLMTSGDPYRGIAPSTDDPGKNPGGGGEKPKVTDKSQALTQTKGQDVEQSSTKGADGRALADARDAIAQYIAKGVEPQADKDGYKAFFNNLKGLFGEKTAQELVTTLNIANNFNKDSDASPDDKVMKFFSSKPHNKETASALEKLKVISGSPLGYKDSPDITLQHQLAGAAQK